MLQAIISPAKQMRIAQDAFAPQGIPPFPTATERLRQELLRIEREQGADGLKKLWRVNDKLLNQNIERLHGLTPVLDEGQLDEPDVARAVSAAAFSYVGIQYQSLAPEVLDLDALSWLQDHLWILSGFYGCARPLDAVQPYRLEMGAKLSLDGARDLYGFWSDKLARAIAPSDAGSDGQPPAPDAGCTVVNLASAEYARAVLPHLRATDRVVTCIFGEELRAGKPVQRATASKIARGSMVRWMAEHNIEDARELKGFDIGYRYDPKLSAAAAAPRTPAASEILVFMRA